MSIVREFHRAFGQPAPSSPTVPSEEIIRLRLRLIKEETKEVEKDLIALKNARTVDAQYDAMRRLLKELADLRYVTEGCAVSLGLDIEGAYREVHRSNMSKLDSNGRPIKDAGGKVLKGPNYSEADMTKFVPPIIDIPYEEE